eukprot:TRINITY_DN3844_c0_g1_i11.p1 TRINITY_DN3844_c0_g1~~TRINITY_DN3844_c0_g1_i11.p1  ORF type:complete len:626 (-),score=26.44 TRINITY_DN3844_c0_g1_i11:480-2357(-)
MILMFLTSLLFFSSVSSLQYPNFIRFKECNGIVQSRLGLALASIIAKETNRTLLLPTFASSANSSSTESIGRMYDVNKLERFLENEKIGFTRDLAQKVEYEEVECQSDKEQTCLKQLLDHSNQKYIQYVCPIKTAQQFKEEILQSKELFFKVLDSLEPISELNGLVDLALSRLEMLGGSKKYNFLEVRMEKQWIAHCEKNNSKLDNCLNETFNLGEHLQSKGVETDSILYVTAFWPAVEEEVKQKVLQSLEEAGYNFVTQTSITLGFKMPGNKDLDSIQRRLIDYYIAQGSDKFIGNSISTFTASMILERRNKGLWSSYYNGGIIPLQKQIPLYDLPWVFAYNSWSNETDYLVYGLVRSAKDVGGLILHCFFLGDKNSSIYQWLSKEGVIMMEHRPEWITKLTELNTKYTKALILLSKTESVIGAFQRVDLPLLEELKQYNYVLYTDTDTFFRRRVALVDFPQPLPLAIGMGPEMADHFPYNSGVAIFNMCALRRTHAAFIQFIFNETDGLNFQGYGPVDQGAYNQFYEDEVRAWKLPEAFNAKPYKEYNNNALIVHFHGPKPKDYLNLFVKGSCWFSKSHCRYDRALCDYVIKDWYKYVEDVQLAQDLKSQCQNYLSNKTSESN